ncbi:MAG: ABC transporter ATP-binding protein [Spirochaetaceae bacterium]|nr:ABC transporter ATP-binding protein [Spirochaetaceae bacterium]
MSEKKTLFYSTDLEIHFGGLYALRNINIDILENEILGLIGPNGSGKTTFFNVITGIYKPTAGDMVFKSKSLLGKEPHQISRLGISRTYQSSRLCLALSLLDNVLIGMHNRQKQGYFSAVFSRKKMIAEIANFQDRVVELLDVFNPDLKERMFRPVGELPQIDRRRVEVCRAMAAEPTIILLDEPSAGMTPDETQELMEDIRKVRASMSDVSIMIIEHDMSVISSVSERVIAINFGEEIARGTYEEVAGTPSVREAYLGKEVVHE